MMRLTRRKSSLIVLGLTVTATALIGLMSSAAAAAPAPGHGGITVSPAFQQVVVAQDTPSKTFDFSVTNHTTETAEFALKTVDFGSLDENGGVLFMGQSNQALNYKYGLSQWVTLGQDRIVVDPGQTVKVPVTIENKESLAPGGHYGAVLVEPADQNGHPTKVEINQVMSSLLFVTKQGGEIYGLHLQDYSVSTHLFSTPASVKLRFQNPGNVHVIPQGVAYITDPHGRMVKQGFINPGSAIILPETFRQLPIAMQTTAVAWIPGRYHLHIAYRYMGQSSEQTKDVSFIYINGWYVIAGIVIIAVIVLALVNRRFRRLLGWPIRMLRRIFGGFLGFAFSRRKRA